MSTSLISVWQRMREGYTLTADLTGAVLKHSVNPNITFKWCEGLLTPCDESKTRVYQVKYKRGDATVNKKGRQYGSRIACICGVILLISVMSGGVMNTMTHVITHIITILAMMTMILQLFEMTRETNTVSIDVPKQKRVTREKDDILTHNKKCHLPHDPNCDICKRARMRAKNATRNTDRYDIEGSESGNVWGLDYCGPFPPDVDGNVYFLQGVEVGHTNMGYTSLTQSRLAKDTLHAFKSMEREHHINSKHERDTVRVHTDQDTSFEKEFRADLLDRKVRQTDTGGHRPSNNSRTERRIGLVLCTLRAILHVATGGCDYYEQLWGPAVVQANHAVNRSVWSDGTSPHETATESTYELNSSDHVFGAKVVYYEKKVHRQSKFKLTGREGIWVGRSQDTPDAHRVIPTEWHGHSNRYILGKTITTVGCDIDDTVFPLRVTPDTDTSESKDFESFMSAFHHQMYGEHDESEFSHEQVEGSDPILEVERIKDKKGKGAKVKYLVKWVGYDDETWEPSKHLTGCKQMITAYNQSLKQPDPKPVATPKHGTTAHGKTAIPNKEQIENETAVRELMQKNDCDGTVHDWMHGYVSELAEVRNRRLERLTEKQVREQRVEKRAIGMRMLLSTKKDGRRKGRLIVQGFREPRYLDGGAIDAPVASLTTIRTLLFMHGMSEDIVSSIDVSTAFLQAQEYDESDEPKYVYYQPHKHAPREYYRLKGALYGLRSASLSWHKTIATWLTHKDQGFVQGKNDPCIFVHARSGLRLALVVDDVLCKGPKLATEKFYASLGRRFDVKNPDYLTHDTPITYVGLDIKLTEHNNNTYLSIDQTVDLERYLESLDVPSIQKIDNPMPNKWKCNENKTPLNEERAARFRAVIGALNFYACATRYDISYPVSRLAQFSAHPTVSAEQGLDRILKYLRCHSEFQIISKLYNRANDIDIYSDSDLAGDKAFDSRSQSGTMIILNGAPVFWRSKKQPNTAISVACAEIYALSESVKEARLFHWRAEELGMQSVTPIVLQVDNSQSKSFQESTCVQSKLRGTFDIRCDWVDELRQRHKVKVQMVSSVNNCADLCTKAHNTQRFKQLLNLITNKEVRKVKSGMIAKAMIAIAAAA